MPLRKTATLIIVSLAILFIEVALIRWISTESRIFAYVNNLVLLACFLGMGTGSYLASGKLRLYLTPVSITAIILLLNLPLKLTIGDKPLHLFRDIPTFLSSFTDSIIWVEPGQGSTFLLTTMGIVSTLIIFLLIFTTFIPLGRILGRIFESRQDTIKAYSINVLFSIVGIWLFAGLSFLYSPPILWFGITGIIVLALAFLEVESGPVSRIASIVFLAVVVPGIYFIDVDKDSERVVWSPYQKLTLDRFYDESAELDRGYFIEVNNAGFMTLLNLSDSFMVRNPAYFNREARQFSQYDIPYLFASDPDEVLILGAGAGNDVAGAIRNHAGTIDAVEIDPGIYALGVQYHPEHPYSDSRVNMFIDDARSYLKKTGKKYDIISVGLLDSHTHSSAYNNTRLDHYVYTRESFQEMKDRLKDDGILTVIFEAQRPWIARRLHNLLGEVFGQPPLAFVLRSNGLYGWGGTMYITGNDFTGIESVLNENPFLHRFISRRAVSLSQLVKSGEEVRLTTDNWPYLYLEKPAVPRMHLALMIILGFLAAVSGKALIGKNRGFNFNFFFLGAGFLLLEFQNVSKSTLLFGSTWLVNALIFSAILVLILAANYYAHRVKPRGLKPYYALLVLTIIINLLVPLSIFNSLAFWLKSVVSMIILNLPVFFAGIIFIETFRTTPRKDLALGSNLIGAAVGGLLESVSFIIGIQAMLILIGILYAMSFLTGLKAPSLASEVESPVGASLTDR